MQYQVFVKNIAANDFLASVIGLPDCAAVGKTAEDAVNQVKAALKQQLAQGQLVTIEIEDQHTLENPLLKYAGRFKDDPYFDDVLAEIQKYRRELDAQLRNE